MKSFESQLRSVMVKCSGFTVLSVAIVGISAPSRELRSNLITGGDVIAIEEKFVCRKKAHRICKLKNFRVKTSYFPMK